MGMINSKPIRERIVRDDTIIIQKYENDPVFDIDPLCLQTFPCKHHVNVSNGSIMLEGTIIRKILLRKGIENKHFEHYDEFIRRKENPTILEIMEDKLQKIETEKQIKKTQDMFDEEKKQLEIGKACGSHKRLDKLKKDLIK